MRTDLFLAWRFLRDGRAQTWLLVAGAAVGLSIVFFITAMMDAIQKTMVSETLDVLPHIVIRRPDEALRQVAPVGSALEMPTAFPPAQRLRSLENWPALVKDLEQTVGVVAVSPTATGPAIASRATATRAITLMGVDADRFPKVISITRRMRFGSLSLDGNQAVIGTELASEFGVRVGDRVQLAVDSKAPTTFHISGIFDFGNRDVNRRWVLVSLRHGQTLLDLPNGVSAVDLRVNNFWAAEDIARILQQRTKLKVESWIATNSQLMVALNSQAGSRDMIRVLIAVAVAMGIASVLIVSVVQRSRQIGILRAMGMERATVVRVFLWQGASIGLLGAVFGTALGSVFACLFEGSATNPDGSPTYAVNLSATLFIGCGLLAILTGMAASLLPARRAARLDPAEAIRHE